MPRCPCQRDGDAGDPEQRAFQRARDRARVGHVVAEVIALVDAGDDEIGRAPGVIDLRDRDVDAVGRRAVDLVDAIAQPLHPKRPAQRQRVADRAGFDVRRDNRDFSEIGESCRQRMDAVRVDAIIIGYEDSGHQNVRIA